MRKTANVKSITPCIADIARSYPTKRTQPIHNAMTAAVRRNRPGTSDGVYCPICFDHVQGDGWALPCGHRICPPHRNLLRVSNKGLVGFTKQSCPVCRAPISWHHGLYSY